MNGRRATLALATLSLAAAPALADLSSVAVGRIRVSGASDHRVWVSALDGGGHPVAGLRERDFEVLEDATPVERLRVESWGDLYDRLEATLIVDPDLLASRHRASFGRVIRAIGEAVGARGRIRVVLAAPHRRSIEAPADHAGDLADKLAGLAREGDEPRFYDAIYSEVRRVSQLPRHTGRVLLVVTRGLDAGSHQGVVEILAIAGESDQPAPVFTVLVTDRAGAPESERLARLGIRTGGAAVRVSSADELESTLLRQVDRARGAYRLSFRPVGWDRSLERHELRVSVVHEGQRRFANASFETADVSVGAWWRRPALWLWVAALLGFALVAHLAMRRKPLFVLHIDNGDEEGHRYEVYATPLTLGAAEGNDVTFDESELSRNHSVLDRRGKAIEIVDLNSENGTFVNGERVTRRVLADGDQISLGRSVELTFESGAS